MSAQQKASSERVIRMYYGLATLPNVEGYRFRGIEPDGDLIPCRVAKNRLGTYFAVHEATGDGVYDYLRGWMPYDLNELFGNSEKFACRCPDGPYHYTDCQQEIQRKGEALIAELEKSP